MRKFTRFDHYLSSVLRRLVSRRTTFRGPPAAQDGRITLLTVDYHVTDDAIRLIHSFRKFVDQNGPVVVVQNAEWKQNNRLRALGNVTTVNFGRNLGHGLGLDIGMRRVSTQYTLICDPDAAIVSSRFSEEVLSRVAKHGVASVDNGCAFHHPICLCFETRLWKTRPISFLECWHKPPGWDVGGQLTYDVLGGLKPGGLMPRTRSAGPPLPSAREGMVHYYGEVFGDVFSNTYCVSRMKGEPDRQDFDGWSRSELTNYHEQWRGWVESIVRGAQSVEQFPTGVARPVSQT